MEKKNHAGGNPAPAGGDLPRGVPGGALSNTSAAVEFVIMVVAAAIDRLLKGVSPTLIYRLRGLPGAVSI